MKNNKNVSTDKLYKGIARDLKKIYKQLLIKKIILKKYD